MTSSVGSFRRAFLAAHAPLKDDHDRVVPLRDYISDRWEKAIALGFGDGTSDVVLRPVWRSTEIEFVSDNRG